MDILSWTRITVRFLENSIFVLPGDLVCRKLFDKKIIHTIKHSHLIFNSYPEILTHWILNNHNRCP